MSNKNHVSNVKKGEAWGGGGTLTSTVLINPEVNSPEVNSQNSSDIL